MIPGEQATRTRRLNILRGLLREFGVTIPVGAHHVVPHVRELLEDADAPVPLSLRPTLATLCDEIRTLEQRVREVERQLTALTDELPHVAHLQTIPGIGVLGATALVACVGDMRRFTSGRHFASYLGLTPKEHSSGSRRRLGAISKQGDRYLRTLVVQGARSVLWHSKAQATPLTPFRTWALEVERRRGHNKAAVAVANKLARIIWRVWQANRPFTAERPVAA